MCKVDHHKRKYYDLYMNQALNIAKESVAMKRRVGAVIVLPSGITSQGFNGTPAGNNNLCEYHCADKNKLVTKDDVIHAEINALLKLRNQNISAKDSIMFVTTAPCIYCAKQIIASGITKVIFRELYSSALGITLLEQNNVSVERF